MKATWFSLVLFLIGAVHGQQKLIEEFDRLDANADGILTAEEAPARAGLIRLADEDQSGGVTMAEVRDYLQMRTEATKPDEGGEARTIVAEKFPGSAPFTMSSCARAAEYSDLANGHAVLVMHRGKIVFEHYANGWAAGKAHRLASGTKSFSGAMLAAAVKDGLIKVDERVCETITEWQDDPKLAVITIADLLSLTSGIEAGKIGSVPEYAEAIKVSEPKTAPGKRFEYGPVPYQIFGEVMKRKLKGQDPVVYLKKKIFEPIGMEVGAWMGGEDGDSRLPSGAFLKATEWIKFGEFLRTDGGKILDEATLKRCVTGSQVNSGYGLTFWLVEGGFYAAGAGKQRLYVLPGQETVILRFGETAGGGFDDKVFLHRLLLER